MSDTDDKNTWRYLVVGVLFGWLAIHMLVTGQLPVDKRHTVFITRAADPLIYWLTVMVAGTLSALCARKLWKSIFGKQ